MESGYYLQRKRFHAVGRVVSLAVLALTIVVIVAAFIRSRRQTRPPGPLRAPAALKADVSSIVEGYNTVRVENGRQTFRLTAARDIAYSDGHHDLEEIDLTAFGATIPGPAGREASGGAKTTRIVARRGRYLPGEGLVTFEGDVVVTSSDGLVVTTESLQYQQQDQIATTGVGIGFRQGEIEGHSVGARLSAVTRQLTLLHDVRVISRGDDPQHPEPTRLSGIASPTTTRTKSGGIRLPIEIGSQTASYDEIAGLMRFEGEATAIQGDRTARAATMVGHIDQATRRLRLIELRGAARLSSTPDPRSGGGGQSASDAEIVADEIDFQLDSNELLTSSVARGNARVNSGGPAPGTARKAAPGASVEPVRLSRSILAARLDVEYRIVGTRSLPQKVTSTGRTTARFESREGAGKSPGISERVVEADGMQAFYREDGQTFSRITANGNAVLTVTPRPVTPRAERKTLRGDQFLLNFTETANLIRNFTAESLQAGRVVVEFEPLSGDDPRLKNPKHQNRNLSGRRLTAAFNEQTQDLAELVVDGAARFSEDDRTATAARATYAGPTRIIAMRGKPQVWDSAARTDADEIDANLESGESLLRGKVRTTYFSRDTTGGATPFRNRQAPVTIASESAVVRHREGTARYSGNVRAWQEDDFIRADKIEIDRDAKTLLAAGNAQSAYYQIEREIEKGRKQIVPVFATADRIRYNDSLRRTFYDGSVTIRQGPDLLESASAEALMDEAHRLVEIVSVGRVVMTQPDRLAKGDRLVYTVRDEVARLTGKPATVEDRQHQVLTTSELLTLHLRDGKFEASNGGGEAGRKRVKTTHQLK